MPLQSSGAISIGDIAAEFGGSAPHSLSEYYRGGGLVPDTPANAGIPTSGTIKLSDFYGGDATEETVSVAGATRSYTALNPEDAEATLQVSVNDTGGSTKGKIQFMGRDVGDPVNFANVEDWVTPNDFAGSYWVRATLVSGDAPSVGTLNSWIALTNGGSDISWTWTDSSPLGGSVGGVLLLEFSDDSGGSNILDSAQYDISANVST